MKSYKNILVTTPHTDDVVVRTGGSIAKFFEEGDKDPYAAFSTAEQSVPEEQIGTYSLIIANAIIAECTAISENGWVSPSSSIIHKCTVADNSLMGLGTVVVKLVKENEVIAGNSGKVPIIN